VDHARPSLYQKLFVFGIVDCILVFGAGAAAPRDSQAVRRFATARDRAQCFECYGLF
jgi:hypothetical protein